MGLFDDMFASMEKFSKDVDKICDVPQMESSMEVSDAPAQIDVRVLKTGRMGKILSRHNDGWIYVQLDASPDEDGEAFSYRTFHSTDLAELDEEGREIVKKTKKPRTASEEGRENGLSDEERRQRKKCAEFYATLMEIGDDSAFDIIFELERERDAALDRAATLKQRIQTLEQQIKNTHSFIRERVVPMQHNAKAALKASETAFEASRAESRRFAGHDLAGLDLAGLAALATSLDIARSRVQAAREARLTSVSEAFICPITCLPMHDPVVLADGLSYERAAIARWLETHDTSPRTNLPLVHKHLTPNITLRNAIRDAGIG